MKIIKINTFVEEELYIALQRCECGGELYVISRSKYSDKEKNNYDNVLTECQKCKKKLPFNFLMKTDFSKIKQPRKPYIINDSLEPSEAISAEDYIRFGLYFWERYYSNFFLDNNEKLEYIYHLSINSFREAAKFLREDDDVIPLNLTNGDILYIDKNKIEDYISTVKGFRKTAPIDKETKNILKNVMTDITGNKQRDIKIVEKYIKKYNKNNRVIAGLKVIKNILSTLFIVFYFLILEIFAYPNPENYKHSLYYETDWFKSNTGVKIEFEYIPKLSNREITYTIIKKNEYNELEEFLNILVEEFEKYPITVLKRLKLSKIYIVKNLYYGEDHRSALPMPQAAAMLYDAGFINMPEYTAHVIHHEFYHFIEYRVHGTFFFHDINWCELNPKNFIYKGKGKDAYKTNIDVYSIVFPALGFVNLYSMFAEIEDKAEIYACFFIDKQRKLVNDKIKNDPFLKKKTDYMLKTIRRDLGRIPIIEKNFK